MTNGNVSNLTVIKKNHALQEMRLEVPEHVWRKIMYWVDKADQEVSGFGSLEWIESENKFIVKDAIILKQTVTSASTEIDSNAIGKAMFELRNEPNGMKWHWHSHVNMSVFWSSDDRKLISDLATGGWIVATVVNRKRESKTAFSCVQNILGCDHEIFIDDLKAKVTTLVDKNLEASWDKEFSDKVTEEKVTAYGGWKGGDFDDEYWDSRDWSSYYGGYENAPFLVNGKEVMWKKEYTSNEFGFCWSLMTDGWLYIPTDDLRIKNDEKLLEAMLSLTEDEADFAKTRSKKFADKFKEFGIYYPKEKKKDIVQIGSGK